LKFSRKTAGERVYRASLDSHFPTGWNDARNFEPKA